MFTTKHTMPLDPLSPTCSLTTEQRVQLMKSTRKVAKLLGATPQIKIRSGSPQVIRNQDGVLVVRGRQSSLDETTMLLPPRITAPRATCTPIRHDSPTRTSRSSLAVRLCGCSGYNRAFRITLQSTRGYT
ncbi:hypothetical protein PENSPDRAFT_344456 [Peniophora sp. CONT]|nr:hypothetical protein PENSPDRAFT_344456 [Peniophora sp. CONT]